MLVAHEAHYRMDDTDGRLGLLYARRRSLDGDLESRVLRVVHSALEAAAQLEREPTLAGLRFRADELELGIDDRLLAPNDDSTLAWLGPALLPLLERMYGAAPTVERTALPKRCFAARVSGQGAASVAELLARLGTLPREGR
jgi:hypothetical protein